MLFFMEQGFTSNFREHICDQCHYNLLSDDRKANTGTPRDFLLPFKRNMKSKLRSFDLRYFSRS